jgi:hypothetical protein
MNQAVPVKRNGLLFGNFPFPILEKGVAGGKIFFGRKI